MNYYLILGLLSTLVYQLTPSAWKRPYKFLENIPAFWFVLFSIIRGLMIILVYPLFIAVMVIGTIHRYRKGEVLGHWLIDDKNPKYRKSHDRLYDEILKYMLSQDSSDMYEIFNGTGE